MKSYRFSPQKHSILLSLALFCPELLAAESLNFNYTRDDAISVDPRLLRVHAQTCHSKGDPMEIRVRFGQMKTRKDFRVTLTVNGAPYVKNYSAFSATTPANTDFQVPWRVQTTGNISGNRSVNELVEPERLTPYERPFCFSPSTQYKEDNQSGFFSHEHAKNTDRYVPVFDNSRYGRKMAFGYLDRDRWRSTCSGKSDVKETRYVWGGMPGEIPMPAHIRKQMQEEKDFLFNHIFYFSGGEKIPPRYEDRDKRFDETVNQTSANPSFSFTFPDDSMRLVRIQQGELILKLNNRNISTLSLTISDNSVTDTWTWSAEKNSTTKNNLYLQHRANLRVKPTTSHNSDLYSENKFYVNQDSMDRPPMYRGALAAGTSLSQRYRDYINTTPLSLPPDSAGTINLVSTQSLLFTIENDQEGITFSAYGQPLKFAPLYLDGKEIASAMQLRNTCY